ncbi:acetyl-CoA carboxylase carboxyltransferase subunit alpha [Candidatus Odyssella thessalonicensis]|uniref:acetyl-CoA carboxylase carboxyltransferase subunit alpha n=1 Tax=Candidatus Odyssella thessalonicensis TaxID=84647 RepID=UPI000225BDAB|nr:acetyl-CoA carboxylase carboxyltransferase subunit alpha [Candidatus Odyssella thessalonicensis]
MAVFLDFEKPVAEMEGKIEELRHLSSQGDLNIVEEISRLQSKVDRMLRQLYANLTPWQKVQVARHPNRPQFLSYLNAIVKDFLPLSGDRCFADDQAIIGGIGRIGTRSVMVIGQQKGNDLESRVKHNFGMAKPEGYRKAIRLMQLADRFALPIVTFIDTAGAYPGIDAEERGQAEAIAKSIETCLRVKVPLISIVIGEGGSGGAIAIAAANAVLMLEHSVYSVISPEGCASILWRSATKAPEAAEAQKLTAQDLYGLGITDKILSEPIGGAHRNPEAVIETVAREIEHYITTFANMDGEALLRHRYDKFLAMGSRGLS